jgi:HEAT repeat protein
MASHASGLKILSLALIAVTGLCDSVGVTWGQGLRQEYQLSMYANPQLEGPERIRVFPEGLQPLWLRALERPAPELQRVMIDTLAVAHQRGLEGLDEFTPKLLEILQSPNPSPQVRRAILSTLIALDARQHAQVLADVASQHGLLYAQAVEPALARWKSPVMKQAWLERVAAAKSGDTLMMMAIEGLGALGVSEAAPAMEKIVRDPNRSAQLRILAARALGNTEASGLDGLAGELLRVPAAWPALNPVLAIELLAKHDDEQSLQLLEEFVQHDNSAVQARSLQRLFQIDVDLVYRHAADLIDSNDVNVRRWCAKALIARREVTDIEMLSRLLDDQNPKLRREAAAGLLDFAKDQQLREEVLASTMEILGQDSWRGCEQAAVVLAKLDHKAGGPRLVELLGHPRGEVKVASAWALKQLQVAELLPDMLDHAESVYQGYKSGQLSDRMRGMSLHLTHLFIAFGEQDFKAAEPLLRLYLPKNFDLGYDPRAAAAWAIGLMYEGDPQQDLARIFVERLSDTQGMEPEVSEVRQMCAIGLGRMKAKSELAVLRSFAVGQDPVSRACFWSIEQLTGESPPPLVPLVSEISDWFLAPAN